MLRIQQLKLPVIHTPEDLKAKMIKILRIRPEDLIRYEIIRKSLDARGGELKYVYLVDVEVKRELSVLQTLSEAGEQSGKNLVSVPCSRRESA